MDRKNLIVSHRRHRSDARHEILNETNHDEVIAAIITWIDRVTE